MKNAHYAWIIDTEHDEDGSTEAIKVQGPRDASEANLARLEKGFGHRFRLYDDDGILNLSGRIVYNDPDIEDGFEPLDDYGVGGYGCTAIKFPHGVNGAWVTL